MKKRVYGLLAAALCAGVLAGCAAEQESAAPYTKEQVQALLDEGVFSETLEELDCDVAWALYGLEEQGVSRDQLIDGMIFRSAGATCEEAALLILEGEEAAESTFTAVEQYLEGQVESNRDYRPAEIPKLESAYLERRGETVLLVVAPDSAAVKEILEK